MYFFLHFTATDPMFLHWEYRKLLGQILWESVYNFAKSKGSDMMRLFAGCACVCLVIFAITRIVLNFLF